MNNIERVSEGGNLFANLGLIDINTWQTSQEVWKAWQSGVHVVGVNTANLAVYRLVDGNVVFDLLGRDGNPFLDERFQKSAYQGIKGNGFFIPHGEMKNHILSAVKAGQSVSVNYSGLSVETEGCSNNYCFVEVGRRNSDEEKKLFSAVFGAINQIDGKRVYLLREGVVKNQLQERSDDFIARACYFDNSQVFGADGRLILNYCSAVRGVKYNENKKNAGVVIDGFEN